MARPLPKDHERWEDPIVAEVRRAREQLFAAAGYDLDVFCRQLRERQEKEGRHAITRPPRRPQRGATGSTPAARPNKRMRPTRKGRARG
jgi:hypothetical protein